MKISKQLFLILIFLIIILVGFVVYIVTNYFMNSPTLTSEELEKFPILSFLVVGLDESSNVQRTDSIYVVLYSTITNKIFIYSIPRDLRVRFQYQGQLIYDKINHVYFKRDIYTLKSLLETLLGIKIPYYVIVSYDALSSIVDLINGVQIYIEEDMVYTDKAGNLFINIPKGFQTLDGEKALEYVRYRSDEEGDIGRIKRQFNLIIKVVEQKDKLLTIKNIPDTLKILYSKLKTNLTLLDFYSLADKLEYLSINKIYYEIMPTKPLTIDNVSYLVPLTVQGGNYAQYLLKKVLTFLNEKEITYENAITVEVLNASPQKGLAKLVRDKLLQYGINVIYYGNSNNSSKVTRIIDRVGKLDKAEQIGAIMRCKNIETAINLNAGVDVTIIIGEDFNMSFFDN